VPAFSTGDILGNRLDFEIARDGFVRRLRDDAALHDAEMWLRREGYRVTALDAGENDPRLMVFPTSWGRVWAGSLTWDAHWSEVLSKTPDHKSRANTNDMKLQLWCHLDLGAQFWKDSYNLDTSLHRGRLDAYTSHRCN
jgi:hypothetical protein